MATKKGKRAWSPPGKKDETLHPKQLTVNITKEDIEGGEARDPHRCVVACAIAREHPDWKHISVDAATIRYTRIQRDGTRLRNIAFTPPRLQRIVIDTDEDAKAKIRPTKAVALVGMVTVEPPRGRPRKNSNKKKRRAIAALKRRPKLVKVNGGNNVPIVIGGKEPPAPGMTQRRRKGLRSRYL